MSTNPSANDTLEVIICDKTFRVSCPPEEQETLRTSAHLLDKKMREIRTQNRISGFDRIAVIAALNISRELLTRTNTVATAEHENFLIQMIERMNNVLSDAEKHTRTNGT